MNSDMPEMLCLSTITSFSSGFGLFTYCINSPVNDSDVLGYLSAKQAAAFLDPVVIFGLFTTALLVNYSRGLVTVGGYVTKTITPIVVKAFWWKPWLAAGIIVAAVAIIVASVAIIYASKAQKGNKTKIPSKLKSGDNVKTPKSHKGEFTKNRGGSYTHDKTKWRFENSKDGHYKGEHWHASPPNGKTGDYYNISPDGRILS